MKLKLQKILLTTEVIGGGHLLDINRYLIHSSKFNSFKTHLYHPNINIKMDNIFSVPPTSQLMKYDKYDKFKGVNVSAIHKYWTNNNVGNISRDLSKLSLLDVFNWLKFLSIADFKGHNNYVLVLYNLNTLIGHKYPSQSLDLKLSNKYEVLSKKLDKQMEDSDYLNTDKKKDIHAFDKHNQQISNLIKSKDKYFIDDKLVSNHKMHQCCLKLINSLRKQVLDLEMKSSKPKLCPFCHHLTYSKFKFCQYCGKQIAK